MVDEVFNFLDSKNVFCVSIHGDFSSFNIFLEKLFYF